MKPSLLSRSVHKWLALFVGLQLLVWAVTGFYMVAVDLDFIHGDPLVRNLRTPLDRTATLVPICQLARSYYAGRGQLNAVQLLEHDVPMEIRGRSAPLWRAEFDDWLQTTLYL